MEKSSTNNDAPEKQSFLKRAIQIAVYPISAVAGLVFFKKDVHENAYQNLKRYGAFNDFLEKGYSLEGNRLLPSTSTELNAVTVDVAALKEIIAEQKIVTSGIGLRVINEANVRASNNHTISPAEFQNRSRQTKIAYSEAVTLRMAEKEMGPGIRGLINKFNYMSRAGKAESILKFATVTGVAAGVLVAMSNSRLFNDHFADLSKDETKQVG